MGKTNPAAPKKSKPLAAPKAPTFDIMIPPVSGARAKGTQNMANETVEEIIIASDAIAEEVVVLTEAATTELKGVTELKASIQKIAKEVVSLKTEIGTHWADIERLQKILARLEAATPPDDAEIEKLKQEIATKEGEMRHALDEMSVKKSDIEQKKKASEALKATLSSHPPATGQAPKIPPGSRLRPPTGDRPLRPPVSPNK